MNKLVFIVAILAAVFFAYTELHKHDHMTAQELIALSKSDPKAFDAYVQSQINALPMEAHMAPANRKKPQPITPEELLELSRTNPVAFEQFLAAEPQGEGQHTETDKLLNLLAHGKYE